MKLQTSVLFGASRLGPFLYRSSCGPVRFWPFRGWLETCIKPAIVNKSGQWGRACTPLAFTGGRLETCIKQIIVDKSGQWGRACTFLAKPLLFFRRFFFHGLRVSRPSDYQSDCRPVLRPPDGPSVRGVGGVGGEREGSGGSDNEVASTSKV